MEREIALRLTAARAAARLAGDMIHRERPESVTRKGMNDYVTEMDVKSERTIRQHLLSRFPQDAFWGEEGGECGRGRFEWIVDPIDGTTNYIKNLPLYTVSIGLSMDGEWVAGCVYAPAMGEMYWAQKGQGAYLNDRPIHVSLEDQLGRAVVGMSFAHRNAECGKRMLDLLPRLTGGVNDLRRMGSAAYDLCQVAAGRLDAFLELDLNAYDIAAGTVIAREAGAVVTGWAEGEAFEQTGNILSSTPALHRGLREILQ